MTVRLTSSHGSWALPAGATVFGRSKSCDICLLDSRLSRRHVCFHVEHSHVVVEDLGSTNGILLNGQRVVGRQDLTNGDQLVVGPCVITVLLDPTMRPSEVLRALTPAAPTDKPGIGDDTDFMNPALPPETAHGSPGRRVDPAISAATGGADTDRLRPAELAAPSTDAVSPRRRSTTSTHKPSDLLASNQSALAAAHEMAATVADDQDLRYPPPPPEPHTQLAPSTVHPFPTGALATTPGGRRVLAGLLDAIQSGTLALALALPPLVVGYVLALRAAGAVLRDGLPRLTYTTNEPASAAALAGSLLHAGGLQRAWTLASELQQHYEPLPALLLFAGVTAATLAFVLTHVLGTVVATVLRGGPLWHRRLGLAIVDSRTGAWPGWGRALARWSLLLVLWPLAPLGVLRRRRGLHDRLSGCEIRIRR